MVIIVLLIEHFHIGNLYFINVIKYIHVLSLAMANHADLKLPSFSLKNAYFNALKLEHISRDVYL